MNKVAAFLLVIGFLFLIALVLGLPIMWLWNLCLVPAIPSLMTISFWQAIGIKLLIGLLIFTSSKSNS